MLLDGGDACRFLQGDVHVAMWAGHFFAESMGGKFNVLLAEEAGHFERFLQFAQSDNCLTLRAGNFPEEVPGGKFYVSATGGAGHLKELRDSIRPEFNPKPSKTTNNQKKRRQAEENIRGYQ